VVHLETTTILVNHLARPVGNSIEIRAACGPFGGVLRSNARIERRMSFAIDLRPSECSFSRVASSFR
jgi:hypothetical protein